MTGKIIGGVNRTPGTCLEGMSKGFAFQRDLFKHVVAALPCRDMSGKLYEWHFKIGQSCHNISSEATKHSCCWYLRVQESFLENQLRRGL